MVEIAQNLFSTRRRSLVAGAVAAGLAVIVLVVYLHNYRSSVNSAAATGPVLVAKQLIPKGTSGDIVASTVQYQVAQLPKSEFKDGAITDPGILAGRVALTDIYPRQQLTSRGRWSTRSRSTSTAATARSRCHSTRCTGWPGRSPMETRSTSTSD